MKTLWDHGDTPTSTILNEYSTALESAHDTLGDLGGWSPAMEHNSEAVYLVLHTNRYLHFVSNGEITDLTGANVEEISEDEDGSGVFDLDTLDWLTYGQLYYVTGVSICCEDWSL